MTKRRNNHPGGTLSVNDIALRWTVRSAPQRTAKVGLRLSVTMDGFDTRELVLEYPYQEQPRQVRELPAIDLEALVADIRLAMEAGWIAKSRGRPFIFALYDEE